MPDANGIKMMSQHGSFSLHTVSHAHLENLEGYDYPHKTLQLLSNVDTDVYCAEVMVQPGKSAALVCVHRGTCYVNGEETSEGQKPKKMKNGTILSTSHYRYAATADRHPRNCR